MKKYDIICPHCGHRNNDLYLQETEGWFECENCLTLTQVSKDFEHSKCKININSKLNLF